MKSPNPSRTRANRAIRFWPAFALLPILVVGSVKATGFTRIGAIDATVISVAFLLGASVVALLRRPSYPIKEMIPYLLFALVVLGGVARSDPGEYQALKARGFFFLTGVVVACIPVLIQDNRDLRGFLAVWLVGGTAMALLVVGVGGSEDLYGRAGIDQATLGPAYLSAAALVVGVTGFGERIIPVMVALPAIALSGVALISIGSRGPMIGAVVGVIAWVLLRGIHRARAALALAGFALVLYAGVQMASQSASTRLLVFEDSARKDLWTIARTSFAESPIMGLGWGDYATVSWAEYPHNAFLEAGAELGIVGIIALGALLLVGLCRLWRYRSKGEVRVLAALVVLNLVGQQFSSDLTNRVFWIALVPALLLPHLFGEPSSSPAPDRGSGDQRLRGPRLVDSGRAIGP